MKLTKMLICALAMGAVTFASNTAFALQGTITVSGTALSQNVNSQDFDVVQKNSITQKRLLFLLEQATGDTSITNKPTKIIYDPDAFNDAAYFSNQGYNFSGVFYYSNSVAGLVELDGTTTNNDYYSYIEFDYLNFVMEEYEGFWNETTVEAGNIFADSQNKITGNGNGLLYVHSNPALYNLPNNNQLFANTWDGTPQQYALVFRGKTQFTWSSNNNNNKHQESFNLTGSGDGIWDGEQIVVNGTVKFNAHGTVSAP